MQENKDECRNPQQVEDFARENLDNQCFVFHFSRAPEKFPYHPVLDDSDRITKIIGKIDRRSMFIKIENFFLL